MEFCPISLVGNIFSYSSTDHGLIEGSQEHCTMAERIEWVEIIEPRSGEHMFANLKTGQCLWEPPPGTKVKKTNDNQWWELYDTNTRRYYYHNATTQKTVWRKPRDGDIIPLAKLQQIKARENIRKFSEDSLRGSSRKGRSGSKSSAGSGDIITTSGRSAPKYENVDISVNMKNDLRLIDTSDGDADPKPVPFSEPMKRKVSRSSSLGEPDSIPFARGPSKSKSMKEGHRFRGGVREEDFGLTRMGSTSSRAPPKPPRQTAAPPVGVNDSLEAQEEEEAMAERHVYDTPEEVEKNKMEWMETEAGEQKWGLQINGTSATAKSKTIERPTRPAPAAPQMPNYQVASQTLEGRRRLPDLDVIGRRPILQKSHSLKQTSGPSLWSESLSSRQERAAEGDFGRETPKSPFSQMMAEVEEYNKANPSPSGMITDQEEVKPPETPSPSGTLLPQFPRAHYVSVYDNLENDQKRKIEQSEEKVKTDGQDEDLGDDGKNSYAERLASMGMPLSTAALVDACDPVPVAAPAREGAVSRSETDKATLTRMKSDSSVIMKRPETPDKQATPESSLSHRPISMLSVSTKSKDFPLRWTARGSTSSEPSNLNEKVPLSTHRKGILRKRVSIHSMLSWSKVPIKKPMVITRDKQVRKDAVDVFKLILQYMGDKNSRKSTQGLGLEIVTKGWTTKGLRDEIYIQLCKQTTANERASSLQRGWELVSICLAIFPPSVKFHSYLEGYIYRHLEPEDDELGVPVSSYAKHCYKQLERICQAGAKKGQKKPTVDEIEAAKNAVFNPSLFGNSLEDIMEMQRNRWPDRKMPWILTTLAEAVNEQGGLRTEGIFRVPGDIDEVNSLKVQIDKWQPPGKLHDPHVPGSLLKLWFRELYDPLIPNTFYENCINNCDNSTVAISIIYSLPDINKLVLSYLIRFLQMYMAPEVVGLTKMDASNLAMVWAPNCLRCPSDDPMEIFENTRKEMTFLRTLMTSYDTSFLQGVV